VSDVIAALHSVETEVRRLRDHLALAEAISELRDERDRMRRELAEARAAHTDETTGVAAFLEAVARGDGEEFEPQTRLQVAALDLAWKFGRAKQAHEQRAATGDAASAQVCTYERTVADQATLVKSLQEQLAAKQPSGVAQRDLDHAISRIRAMEQVRDEQLGLLNQLHDKRAQLERDLEQATARGDELEAQLKPLQAAAHDFGQLVTMLYGGLPFNASLGLPAVLERCGELFQSIYEHRVKLLKEQRHPHHVDELRAELASLATERDDLRKQLAAWQSAAEGVAEESATDREKQLRCALFLRCLPLPGVTTTEHAWRISDDARRGLNSRDLTEAMAEVLLGKAGT
jgi:hypothetical protein